MNDSVHSDAEINLEKPQDKIEFVAHHMLLAYKREARTWYDLARVAITSSQVYDNRYEGI